MTAMTPTRSVSPVMRVLEWIFLVCDGSLFVLATLLVFVPQARSSVLVGGLHLLIVLAFAAVVFRLFRAKVLSTPVIEIHRTPSVPRPTLLQFAASIMAAIAITVTSI